MYRMDGRKLEGVFKGFQPSYARIQVNGPLAVLYTAFTEHLSQMQNDIDNFRIEREISRNNIGVLALTEPPAKISLTYKGQRATIRFCHIHDPTNPTISIYSQYKKTEESLAKLLTSMAEQYTTKDIWEKAVLDGWSFETPWRFEERMALLGTRRDYRHFKMIKGTKRKALAFDGADVSDKFGRGTSLYVTNDKNLLPHAQDENRIVAGESEEPILDRHLVKAGLSHIADAGPPAEQNLAEFYADPGSLDALLAAFTNLQNSLRLHMSIDRRV